MGIGKPLDSFFCFEGINNDHSHTEEPDGSSAQCKVRDVIRRQTCSIEADRTGPLEKSNGKLIGDGELDPTGAVMGTRPGRERSDLRI